MNEICIDTGSSENIGTSRITSTTLRPNGEFTLSDIQDLVTSFESGITQSSYANTPLNKLIQYYGNEAVYQGTAELNSFLRRDDVTALLENNITSQNYQQIKIRKDANISITPIEYAEFVDQFLYTPEAFNNAMTTSYVKVLKQLDDYYSSNFSESTMGSFCSIATSVFETVDAFFTAIDSATAKINDLLSKIQNLNAAVLLNKLKENITKAIDRIIDRAKDIIEQFDPANIIGRIETFVKENIVNKIAELKESAMKFFSKENIDKLKAKISALIDYAVGVFENPDIDEILFLIQRFCSFISNVETTLNLLKKPLDDFIDNYQYTLAVVSARSLGNTARAVAGGAIRFDDETRRFYYLQTQQSFTDAGNPPPINVSDISGVTNWNNGNGDSRITFGSGLQVGKMGEEGWTGVVPEVRIRLMKVQEIFGKRLTVLSGYRSREYNDRLILAGLPAAPNSLHISRKAIDVTWNDINIQNREEFIRIALSQGFTGIGRYTKNGVPSFVHIDIGPRREWTG